MQELRLFTRHNDGVITVGYAYWVALNRSFALAISALGSLRFKIICVLPY